MWGYLQQMLGLAELRQELKTVSSKISDIKTALDAIAASTTTVGTGVTSVLTTLQQLQDSAANPSTNTTLSDEDQTALDAAVAEAFTIQQSLADLQAKLPAAQAAASSAPPAGASS